MIDRIISFSVRNKLIVGLMILLMIAAGIFSATRLPVDAVPDITNNQVLLITVSPSLAAPEVERLITAPIERVMASLPELKEMRSISRFGLSNVTVVFDDKVDITRARQQVSERLNQLKTMISPGIGETEMGPVTTGLGEVYQYYVVPAPGYENRYTLTDLRTIQEWIVRRQLLGVPGVADVSSLGGKLKQFQVVIDPGRLQSLGVSIDDLFAAVQSNNENTGGAYIEKGANAYFIRTEGMAAGVKDIQDMPVKTLKGIPLKVSDVAEVKEGNALRFGAMYNDRYGEVSGAVVLMLKGANAMEVVKQVEARMEEIKKRLPEGVTVVPYYERSKMVSNSIATVKRNLVEGALIVIFVLVLFLGNLRAGLVVASVIPLSMLFALIVMNLFHVSANLMSLGALDFGLIVDGAVIIVEGVMHQFRYIKVPEGAAGFNQTQMDEEVKNASSRLMNAAIFGQVIILVVYLPILSLQDIEGKMFRPMAETVVFALLGAFLLSLTYVPMMTALTLGKKPKTKAGISARLMSWLEKRYLPVLDKSISHPKIVIGIALVICVGAWFVFRGLGGEFIPQLEEGDFAIDARFLPGTSLSQTIRGMDLAAKALKRFPEVQQVTCRIGSAEIPTDPMSLEQCDVFVILEPKSKWTTAKDYSELEDTMGKSLAQIPGLNVGFEYPVQMRFNELISGAKQDVVVKIFGDNLEQLARLSGQLAAILSRVKGAVDLYTEKITGLPQLVVHYNRSALARYGVSVSTVNHILNSAFAGEKAGSVYEEERQFDVVLRLADSVRGNLEQVGELLVPTASGSRIPLNQLAAIGLQDGPNQIQRENGQRRISVSFNVRGRDVEGVVKDLQAQVQQKLKLPAGYHVEYGGQFQSLNSAKSRLAVAVPASLLFIFILLYFAFGQIREALIVFSAIILAATGGVFALWIRGMSFSISAGVGFIALFGVAVLNGIVLITEFNRLKKEGVENVEERIRQGASNRLRPVLITATVASLGFFPMAVSTHAGAEVQRPLATVVIGGLVTATLLTLVVLPALYRQFATGKKQPSISSRGSLIGIVLLFLHSVSFAQSPAAVIISGADAVNIAMKNSPMLRAAHEQMLALKALQPASLDIPKTQLTYDDGRINSPNTDNRFGISQNFALPEYYRSQRNYFRSQTLVASLEEERLRVGLAYDVRETYLQLVLSAARRRLLIEEDSAYAELIRLETLRFRVGETSRIQLTSAEARIGLLRVKRGRLEAEYQVWQKRLAALLASDNLYDPRDTLPPDWVARFVPDSLPAGLSPEIRQAEAQVKQLEYKRRFSSAKGLPEFSISYNNQSFAGPDVNTPSKSLTRSDRFSSYMAGVNIPLFAGQYHAAAKAAEWQAKAAGSGLQDSRNRWIGKWKEELALYRQQMESLSYYNGAAMDQSRELLRMANLSFQNGDISYLEWTSLFTQSMQLRSDRLDALLQLDQTINQLWYYQAQIVEP